MKNLLIIIAVTSLFSCANKSWAESTLIEWDVTNTLAGVDANKNGIRDDIDSYISKRPYTPSQRKAAQQSAAVYQRIMTINLDDEKSVSVLQEDLNKSVSCLLDVYGDEVNSLVLSEVVDLTSNTKDRVKARIAFNQTFNGKSFPVDYVKPCGN